MLFPCRNVEFAYRIVFYEKVSYLPVRIEYYDKKVSSSKFKFTKKVEVK